MRFEDLEVGTVFTIDGEYYEAATIGERIVVAYVLEWEKPTRDAVPIKGQAALLRQPDPNDLAGDQFLTTAFSDLRFNKNNMTDFERQCDEELKDLL